MKKNLSVLISFFIMAILCSGCLVAESKYLAKVDETRKLTGELAALTEENTSLKNQIAAITVQKDELENILKSKTDDLSRSIVELREENRKLKEQLAELKKKSQEVQAASNTYQELLQEMKAEIAQGEITITELKGKLTMDVVDKILFASGEANVKKEGLAVLKRVVDILKTVDDKNIRIEGHTDNVPITSRLARIYPTNWELAAARAINVARYLQEQGIDPVILSATAFGEYQPVADNATPEGRAKNRRIAIILLPRD
jgi:chemotaxis protein MotB